mmetsp:Transcript_44385/g.105122  ORF Transcript_44385/g.105122 Transcript_44385/m.105122 type:complete len:766 (-) Transcript_44385:51-2348(-)
MAETTLEYKVLSGEEDEGISELTLERAAWQLEDALTERIDVHRYLETGPEAPGIRLKVLRAQVWYSRALLGLVLLTILETPPWCNNTTDWFRMLPPHERCPTDGKTLHLSGIPYIAPGWGVLIELGLLALIFNKLRLELKLQVECFDKLPNGPLVYFEKRWVYFGFVMLGLQLLDVFIFILIHPPIRLNFVFRTGFLYLLPAVQKLTKCVLRVLPDFMSVAVFFWGTILFFAWIAVTIFDDLEGSNEGFKSFSQSFNSMFVAGVSEDFVAVFRQSYTNYRSTGFLWLIFLMLCHVLLLSLVLDTLCAAYKQTTREETEKGNFRKVQGMSQAFRTLASNTKGDKDYITQEGWYKFVDVLQYSPNVPRIPPKNASILFKFVDQSGDHMVELDEFCTIVDALLKCHSWTTRKYSLVKTAYPSMWNQSWYRRFRRFLEDEDGYFTGGQFDDVMTNVLLVNFVLVVLESMYDLNQWEEPAWMDWSEFTFSFIYLGEVCCKLAVMSFGTYWSANANKFDLFTTLLLLSTSILEKVAGSSLSTYANMLRLLRLLRVVKQLKKQKQVQFMIMIVYNLVSQAKDILTLLLVVTFFFTALSIQVYGGLMYEENPLLEGTEYVEKHMTVLNFNDFVMAFGAWFVLLLVEYNPIFPDAAAKVGPSPVLWLIFPAFYMTGVMIVFELVKAFTIEVFMELYQESQEKNENAITKLGEMFQEEYSKEDEPMIFHYNVKGVPLSEEEVQKVLKELQPEAHKGSDGDGKHGHAHGHKEEKHH